MRPPDNSALLVIRKHRRVFINGNLVAKTGTQNAVLVSRPGLDLERQIPPRAQICASRSADRGYARVAGPTDPPQPKTCLAVRIKNRPISESRAHPGGRTDDRKLRRLRSGSVPRVARPSPTAHSSVINMTPRTNPT